MRKVGNMRVPASNHKTKEELEFERNQRDGMLQYIEQMEEQYTKAKAGLTVPEDDEKDFPEEKKDKTEDGDTLMYGVMCQREEDKDEGKWYAVGYTYMKQRAMQSYVFITAMNNVVEPKYEVKVIGIKEKDWLEGYGAAWQAHNEENKEERPSPKDEELPAVVPDDVHPEQPVHEITSKVTTED